MSLVLMGDSHLARVRRELVSLGREVRNVAVGGATVRDLDGQLDLVAAIRPETVVLSVGTNDAAARHGVSRAHFVAALEDVLVRLQESTAIYVTSPGVIESRAAGQHWTNTRVAEYRQAALDACAEHNLACIRAEKILGQLGARAFAEDGLHLNGLGYRTLLPVIARESNRRTFLR